MHEQEWMVSIVLIGQNDKHCDYNQCVIGFNETNNNLTNMVFRNTRA
jgi:hypothetical protein